jgi:LPXTG-site transpeptidase (sortase) family protein
LDAPVVAVSWTTVEVNGQAQPTWGLPESRAAGWHNTSAALGVSGNTVLNGHNTTHGEVFRDLYKLQVGEEIILYSGTVSFTYSVTERLILPEANQPLEVRIENARHIQPTEDERITLVTCHPYGSLLNRLIVIAHPVNTPSLDIGYFER